MTRDDPAEVAMRISGWALILLLIACLGCTPNTSNPQSEGPFDPDKTTEEAVAALKSGDNDRVIVLANRLIDHSPQSRYYLLRASAYSEKRDYPKAIADSTAALHLDEKSTAAFICRAHA